jgi:hypothetical protein
MQISRRGALLGAGAAAAIAATTAPLAIKAALAGDPDARIFALVEEYDGCLAKMKKAMDHYTQLVTEKMPSHLRGVVILDHKEPLRIEAWEALEDVVDLPEIVVLRDKENRLKHRCHDLLHRLLQIEATTLQGVCAKLRLAMRPRHCIDIDIVRAAVADIERLAGEARS